MTGGRWGKGRMTDDIRKLLTQALNKEIRRIEKNPVWTEPTGGTDKLTELEHACMALYRGRLNKYREELILAKAEIKERTRR